MKRGLRVCKCGCGAPITQLRARYATEECRRAARLATYRKVNARRPGRVPRPPRPSPRPPARTWPPPICTIDGEALDGQYCLLQWRAPDGRIETIYTPDRRLTTRECLRHILDAPTQVLFGYSIGYDVSNWLADVPPSDIRPLYEVLRREVAPGLRVTYTPGKAFIVDDASRPHGERRRVIYDLFPFFQRSFIHALRSAGLTDQIDMIERYKHTRGAFSRGDLAGIQAYNEAELHGMARLFAELASWLDAAGLRVRYWYGPGSVARYAAKQRGVTLPEEVVLDALAGRDPEAEPSEQPWAAVYRAFYGGRFELSAIGYQEQMYEYDLISAYPHAMASGMPCFACGGEWRRESWDARSQWSVWPVRWSPRPGQSIMWGPLPVRGIGGHSLAWTREHRSWPDSWYHRCEVEAAMDALADQIEFEIGEGWGWHPACQHDPWSWVGDMARKRAAIKKAEPGHAQALKLALNSLYGITADQAGTTTTPDRVRRVRVPPLFNPYWSGLITARTRARLLEAVRVGGEDIIYLATDGVHARRPLDLPTGSELGDWESPSDKRGRAAVFIAGGNYCYEDHDPKSRGVPRTQLAGMPFEEYLAHYQRQQALGEWPFRDRHFVGVREAANRTRAQGMEAYLQLANTWEERTRAMVFDLAPRREQRIDGRWIAPGEPEYQTRKLIEAWTGADQAAREAEMYDIDQPEGHGPEILPVDNDNGRI